MNDELRGPACNLGYKYGKAAKANAEIEKLAREFRVRFEIDTLIETDWVEVVKYVSRLLDHARNEGAVGAFGDASHFASVVLKRNDFCSHGYDDYEHGLCGGCEHDWEKRVAALPKDIAALTPTAATAWLAEHDKEIRIGSLSEDFTVLFKQIATKPDGELDPSAIELKQAMNAALAERLRQVELDALVWTTGAMSLNERDNAVIQRRIAELSRPKEQKS